MLQKAKGPIGGTLIVAACPEVIPNPPKGINSGQSDRSSGQGDRSGLQYKLDNVRITSLPPQLVHDELNNPWNIPIHPVRGIITVQPFCK